MRRSTRGAGIGVVLAALALALGGCGDDSEDAETATPATTGATTSQAAADAAFCASLDDLEDAAGDLRSLDPANTTITQLTTAATGLGAAWADVRAAAGDARDIDSAALQDAWSGVSAVIQDLPGSGSTPSEAAQALADSLAPLEDAADELRPECDAVGTTTAP